jgi:hypothetical protein
VEIGQMAAGIPSYFPPPDAGPRGTGRNRQGRRVTAEAAGRPFVHVTSDDRDQVGTGGDPRFAGTLSEGSGAVLVPSRSVLAAMLASP